MANESTSALLSWIRAEAPFGKRCASLEDLLDGTVLQSACVHYGLDKSGVFSEGKDDDDDDGLDDDDDEPGKRLAMVAAVLNRIPEVPSINLGAASQGELSAVQSLLEGTLLGAASGPRKEEAVRVILSLNGDEQAQLAMLMQTKMQHVESRPSTDDTFASRRSSFGAMGRRQTRRGSNQGGQLAQASFPAVIDLDDPDAHNHLHNEMLHYASELDICTQECEQAREMTDTEQRQLEELLKFLCTEADLASESETRVAETECESRRYIEEVKLLREELQQEERVYKADGKIMKELQQLVDDEQRKVRSIRIRQVDLETNMHKAEVKSEMIDRQSWKRSALKAKITRVQGQVQEEIDEIMTVQDILAQEEDAVRLLQPELEATEATHKVTREEVDQQKTYCENAEQKVAKTEEEIDMYYDAYQELKHGGLDHLKGEVNAQRQETFTLEERCMELAQKLPITEEEYKHAEEVAQERGKGLNAEKMMEANLESRILEERRRKQQMTSEQQEIKKKLQSLQNERHRMRTELVKINDAGDADDGKFSKSEVTLMKEEAAMEAELLEEANACSALEAEVEATNDEAYWTEQEAMREAILEKQAQAAVAFEEEDFSQQLEAEERIEAMTKTEIKTFGIEAEQAEQEADAVAEAKLIAEKHIEEVRQQEAEVFEEVEAKEEAEATANAKFEDAILQRQETFDKISSTMAREQEVQAKASAEMQALAAVEAKAGDAHADQISELTASTKKVEEELREAADEKAKLENAVQTFQNTVVAARTNKQEESAILIRARSRIHGEVRALADAKTELDSHEKKHRKMLHKATTTKAMMEDAQESLEEWSEAFEQAQEEDQSLQEEKAAEASQAEAAAAKSREVENQIMERAEARAKAKQELAEQAEAKAVAQAIETEAKAKEYEARAQAQAKEVAARAEAQERARERARAREAAKAEIAEAQRESESAIAAAMAVKQEAEMEKAAYEKAEVDAKETAMAAAEARAEADVTAGEQLRIDAEEKMETAELAAAQEKLSALRDKFEEQAGGTENLKLARVRSEESSLARAEVTAQQKQRRARTLEQQAEELNAKMQAYEARVEVYHQQSKQGTTEENQAKQAETRAELRTEVSNLARLEVEANAKQDAAAVANAVAEDSVKTEVAAQEKVSAFLESSSSFLDSPGGIAIKSPADFKEKTQELARKENEVENERFQAQEAMRAAAASKARDEIEEKARWEAELRKQAADMAREEMEENRKLQADALSASQAEMRAMKEELEKQRGANKPKDEKGDKKRAEADSMRESEVEAYSAYVVELREQVEIRNRELAFLESNAGEAQHMHDLEMKLLASALHRLGMKYGRLISIHEDLKKQQIESGSDHSSDMDDG